MSFVITRLPARWQRTARQFLKFGIVGAIGFSIDYGLLTFGIDVLGLGRKSAAMFSFPFAVTFTWLGNRLFTFREAQHESAGKQLAKFAAVCAVGLIFNRGAYMLCVTYIPLAYEYPILGLLAGTATGMFFNFFVTRRHVFGM